MSEPFGTSMDSAVILGAYRNTLRWSSLVTVVFLPIIIIAPKVDRNRASNRTRYADPLLPCTVLFDVYGPHGPCYVPTRQPHAPQHKIGQFILTWVIPSELAWIMLSSSAQQSSTVDDVIFQLITTSERNLAFVMHE